MNILEWVKVYKDEGLSEELAASRVCQDIILLSISKGPLKNNITIKGGVVMRSITNNNRRATRDIDLDFIQYPLSEKAIISFIEKLNCIEGVKINIDGDIKELKHQDYHGKSVKISITDDNGNMIGSKIDIGVHKHFNVSQDIYCFDVCMDNKGVSLLKNSVEQTFIEKMRSLLIFGANSRRYKDVFDMYYLTSIVDKERIRELTKILIFDDNEMRENSFNDIFIRISNTFNNKTYLNRVETSKQKWIDEDINYITQAIINFIKEFV